MKIILKITVILWAFNNPRSCIQGCYYQMNNIIYCGVDFIICAMSYIYPMVVEV